MFTPLATKVARDAWALKEHARVVVLLDKNGNVHEVCYRDSGSLIDVIAILGPYTVKGVLYPLVVRSEIGIGRTAPYRVSEKTLFGQRYWFAGRRGYPLSPAEVKRLVPCLASVMQRVVDKETKHWKSLTFVKASRFDDSAVYTLGKFLSIPTDLELMRFLFLARDMATRRAGHLDEFIEYTKDRLFVAPFASYPPKQLMKKWWAREIAYNLSEAKYGEYFFTIIREALGKEGTKLRNLFEQILEAFSISPAPHKDVEYLTLLEKYRNEETTLLASFPLNVMVHTKRVVLREKKYPTKVPRYRHAVGVLRAEVRASQDAVKQHAARREAVLKQEATRSTKTVST